MKAFPFLTFLLLALVSIEAKEIPTQTREERLVKVEIGTLMERGSNDPISMLLTIKTNKHSYYILQTLPFDIANALGALKSDVLKGKDITCNGHKSGMVLHLLSTLRPDGTPDNSQANAKFYPDISRHAQFNSREWSEEPYPHFNGLYLLELPVPKMPATLGGSQEDYKSVASFDFDVPCTIESQKEQPEAPTNSYFDGVVIFDPPPELERLDERNDSGDNPFSMRSKAIGFRPKGANPGNYQAINIAIQAVGASIGDGKVVTFHPVSDAQLKQDMESANVNPHNEGSASGSKAEEATIAGQKALKIHTVTTTHREMRWQGAKYDKTETMIDDIYWVRIRPNQVLDIHLLAANETLMEADHGWLSTLKIQIPPR